MNINFRSHPVETTTILPPEMPVDTAALKYGAFPLVRDFLFHETAR